MVMAVVLERPRGRIIEQMSDGGLSTATVRIPHGAQLRQRILAVEHGGSSLVLVLFASALVFPGHRLRRGRSGGTRSWTTGRVKG